LRGAISPETVPLCRRCHTTYHWYGVGAFSPKDTKKALKIENKKREIYRSLPRDHQRYVNLPPLRLDEVKHSRYWYKKHGLTPPPAPKKFKNPLLQFRLPASPPLCGEEWLSAHMNDHTMEEVAALKIEVSSNGKSLSSFSASDKMGSIKKLMKIL
jgi:hypothetical protein